MGKVMTVHQVAKYLNMVPDTIYRKARAGEIPAVKMGKCWRFPKDTLDKWLNDRALEANGNGNGNGESASSPCSSVGRARPW